MLRDQTNVSCKLDLEDANHILSYFVLANCMAFILLFNK